MNINQSTCSSSTFIHEHTCSPCRSFLWQMAMSMTSEERKKMSGSNRNSISATANKAMLWNLLDLKSIHFGKVGHVVGLGARCGLLRRWSSRRYTSSHNAFSPIAFAMLSLTELTVIAIMLNYTNGLCFVYLES